MRSIINAAAVAALSMAGSSLFAQVAATENRSRATEPGLFPREVRSLGKAHFAKGGNPKRGGRPSSWGAYKGSKAAKKASRPKGKHKR